MTTQNGTGDADVFRWSPWSELPGFEHRLRQAFSAVWPTELSGGFLPSGDLTESDDAYALEVDLPGVAKKDISIDVNGRRVSVSGVRTEKERDGVLRRSTRSTGSFCYEVTLPTTVNEKQTTASLVDGVLHIALPKAEHAKGSHIKIN